MPNTVNQHLQASPSAELRGFEYRKFADVTAMNLVTGRPGEICTVTDIGLNFEWNGPQARWMQISAIPTRRLTIGSSSGVRRWVRLVEVNGIGNGLGGSVTFALFGTGNFGAAERGMVLVSAAERGGVFTVHGWTFGVARSLLPVEVYSVATAAPNTFEVWARVADFNQFVDLVVFGGANYTIHTDNIGTTAPTTPTLIDIREVATLDNGTTAQRPTGLTAAQRLMWYDDTLNAPIWWNGTTWVAATAAAVFNGSFTGDGVLTSFTVTHNLNLVTPFLPSSIQFLSPTGEVLPPSSVTVDTVTANSFRVGFSAAPLGTETYRVRVVA